MCNISAVGYKKIEIGCIVLKLLKKKLIDLEKKF